MYTRIVTIQRTSIQYTHLHSVFVYDAIAFCSTTRTCIGEPKRKGKEEEREKKITHIILYLLQLYCVYIRRKRRTQNSIEFYEYGDNAHLMTHIRCIDPFTTLGNFVWLFGKYFVDDISSWHKAFRIILADGSIDSI